MKPKTLYFLLCVAGTVSPYSQLVPFLRASGLDLRRRRPSRPCERMTTVMLPVIDAEGSRAAN